MHLNNLNLFYILHFKQNFLIQSEFYKLESLKIVNFLVLS